MTNKYPWKKGDLAIWVKINSTPKTPESVVIVKIHDDPYGIADILADGKIISVHLSDLQVPPVKKVKTNFGIKL
tara:strand:- start:1125 stop:1346 length:222 start_codon:yes stop_codon:yes gene_type:complete